jgi:glycosyltransferase involved in cell wall biosynthesis
MIPRRLRISVAGWRAVGQSYALAAQWICLSLLQRTDVELRFSDRPMPSTAWQMRTGIFSAENERRLAAIEAPAKDEACDIEFRVESPYDLSAPVTGKALIFATAEYGSLFPGLHMRSEDAVACVSDDRIGFVTPAYWNVDAFLQIGVPLDRIFVVPLGFDPSVYKREQHQREQLRVRLGLDGVVLMSVGAMTLNKGIEPLLAAFAAVAQAHPKARLLLKGVDELYDSRAKIQDFISSLPALLREILASRLTYVGETLNNEQMAALYQAADCYVTPYWAEGFCMPALEAAACGLPVICTRGGPTDDFLEESFAKKIDSRLEMVPAVDRGGVIVKKVTPDFDHLVALLHAAISDEEWRGRAGKAAAAHAHANFTWDKVTNRLVEVFKKSACQAP